MINNDCMIVQNAFLFGDSEGPWKTDVFTKALKAKAGAALAWEMTLQQYRHFCLAIERKHIRPQASSTEGEGNDSDSEEVDNPWDQGAGHGTSVAVRRYAREIGFTRTLTSDAIDLWTSFSGSYHKFYDVISVDVRPARAAMSLNRLLTPKEKEHEISRIMTLWYGQGYRWRSPQQQEATERTVSGISPLFTALPTSAGKTVTFLLPAKMKGSNTTVVITPLIELGLQLKRTCKDFGLEVEMFEKGCIRKASVVIVVTETAGTEDFRDFIMELQLNKRLDRVVWDEAHMLVKDQNFRLTIAGSRALQLRCQLVFVTATCPPSLVDDICELMVLPTPHVVRQDYIKPSFRYSVKITHDLNTSAKGMIKIMQDDTFADSKILVFCKTGAEVSKWAREYKARKYYSRLATKQEEWANWDRGLMFATTAVGAGLDKDGIERVLHIGEPYSIIGYIQESARGGRGGDYVESMILIEAEDYAALMATPRESLTDDEAALQDYLRGDVCRNKILTEYLNGRGRTCVEMDTPLCDVCDQQKAGTFLRLKRRNEELVEELKVSAKRQRTYDSQALMKEQCVRDRILQWEWIEEVLKRIGEGCPVCWFLKDDDFNRHIFSECDVWRDCFGRMTMGGIRREYIDYRGLKTSCWSCGLPGDKCDGYVSTLDKCKRQDCVLPVVLYFWRQEDSVYHGVVRRSLSRVFGELGELGSELVKRARVLEENGSVGFKIWVEILKARGGE